MCTLYLFPYWTYKKDFKNYKVPTTGRLSCGSYYCWKGFQLILEVLVIQDVHLSVLDGLIFLFVEDSNSVILKTLLLWLVTDAFYMHCIFRSLRTVSLRGEQWCFFLLFGTTVDPRACILSYQYILACRTGLQFIILFSLYYLIITDL